jgi:hypothetical protein
MDAAKALVPGPDAVTTTEFSLAAMTDIDGVPVAHPAKPTSKQRTMYFIFPSTSNYRAIGAQHQDR